MPREKRIVLATLGSLGDLHPFLALARELRARGHSPVLATSAIYRGKIEADGIEFAPLRPDEPDFGDPEVVFRRGNHPLWGTTYVVLRMILPHLRASYEDLLAASRDADLLVSHTLTYAVPLVAEKRGLPWAGASLQPMVFLSAFDPPVLPLVSRTARLLGLGPGFHRFLYSFIEKTTRSWSRPVRALRRDLGLRPAAVNPIFGGQHSPFLNLALFSPLFAPPQPDWPPATIATGFPFYDGGSIGSELMQPELRAFLDSGPPPVVFTLGSTIVRMPGGFFHESISALRAMEARAVFVTGTDPRNQPPGPLPRRLLTVPYAPYGELFPRAAAIVHQGGIGTTAQALRAGRPQLVVPHAHDQPDNAARVVRLGVGRSLPPGRYAAGRIAATLRSLLDDKACALKAAAMGTAIRGEKGALRAAEAIERALGTAKHSG